MDSRLLTTLNVQAGSTKDPVVWARAVCRAASHFAAHGKTDEALIAIKNVRNQFGKDLHINIASWLMLAEGVLHYFHAKVPEAYDRIRRAYGLAIALRNDSAFPICAAWMAHLEFEACKYSEMAKHLEEAILTAGPADHQALARSSLILAVAYHIAGEFEKSRPWYEKARLNAAAEGDDATVSATLHNMASIRASNVRLEDTFGGDAERETKRVSLEAASSLTYDYAIRHKGLNFLARMLEGLVLTIDSRFSEAQKVFGGIVIDQLPERLKSVVLVDKAWCLVNIGDKVQALSVANEAVESLSLVSEPDDLAYVNSRLSQLARARGDSSAATVYAERAEKSLGQHRFFQQELLGVLESIDKGAMRI
jgi:hypothetical protein